MNKVSVTLQCLATIFVPSGLYAFKRINKFRMGGIVYAVGFGVATLAGILMAFTENIPDLYSFISVMSFVILVVFPMIFMRKWSMEYNSRIKILS